jgi:hypothetical protein
MLLHLCACVPFCLQEADSEKRRGMILVDDRILSAIPGEVNELSDTWIQRESLPDAFRGLENELSFVRFVRFNQSASLMSFPKVSRKNFDAPMG